MKKLKLIGLFSLLLTGVMGSAFAKYEREQLALESQLQQRIESILSKTLPPSSYLVTVKVEMEDRARPNQSRTTQRRRSGSNPFLANSEFMLPGVPQKREFVQAPESSDSETVVSAFEAETLVRKIAVSILVAQDVTPDQVRGIRDVVSASIPFNPLRGDELEVQTSPLLKRVNPAGSNTTVNATPAAAESVARNLTAEASNSFSLPMIVLFAIAGFGLIVLLIFLFGPVRAFLNRLLTVLPRVGEQAAYAVSNSPKTPVNGGSLTGNVTTNGRPMMANGHTAEGMDLPFGFIREDQLNKLPILLRQMLPQQAALVLAYLPPEWASRVLNLLDTNSQSQVMGELSQAREVPPEIVKDVETQVKTKLPYLVGGSDWIQSVYQLTQPQTQQALLGSINQQSPELAQSLRQKSFFFEDLVVLAPGALRLLVQESGYPTIAASIKDEKPEFRDGVLRKLPVAMREIMQQELELSGDDPVAMADAKTRMVTLARRLIMEGRLTMPDKK